MAENDRHSAPSQHYLRVGSMFIPLNCEKVSQNLRQWTLHPLKTPAVLLGMAGAVLVASPSTALIGFMTWLGANALWFWHGVKDNDRYIMLLFGFYFLTSAMGVIGHGF